MAAMHLFSSLLSGKALQARHHKLVWEKALCSLQMRGTLFAPINSPSTMAGMPGTLIHVQHSHTKLTATPILLQHHRLAQPRTTVSHPDPTAALQTGTATQNCQPP